MLRGSGEEISRTLLRRDQRISEINNGLRHYALHMYTFGFNALKEPVKESGNFDQYKEAEKNLAV